VKRRTALKANDGSFWPKGQLLAAYGLWKLGEAASAGVLNLPEGETNCWALWYNGLPALGIPGSGAVKNTLRAGHLEGVDRVYAFQDPDRGGEQFIAGVRERLAELGYRGRAFVPRLPDGIKDVADLYAADPKAFADRIREALLESRELLLPARFGFGSTPGGV